MSKVTQIFRIIPKEINTKIQYSETLNTKMVVKFKYNKAMQIKYYPRTVRQLFQKLFIAFHLLTALSFELSPALLDMTEPFGRTQNRLWMKELHIEVKELHKLLTIHHLALMSSVMKNSNED